MSPKSIVPTVKKIDTRVIRLSRSQPYVKGENPAKKKRKKPKENSHVHTDSGEGAPGEEDG